MAEWECACIHSPTTGIFPPNGVNPSSDTFVPLELRKYLASMTCTKPPRAASHSGAASVTVPQCQVTSSLSIASKWKPN